MSDNLLRFPYAAALLGHWVWQQIGFPDKPRNIPMRLRDAVTHLLPAKAGLVARSHDAAEDARMHALLAEELHRRATT